MCSDRLNPIESGIAQDLWDALLHADGVNLSWQDPQTSLAEEMSVVDENPTARISYPWNPMDPAAAEFFTQLEQSSFLQAWQEAEVQDRATTFFAQIDQLWTTATLQASLKQRFGSRVPHSLLAAIIRNAQAVATQATSLGDQLVQCVHDLLPTVAEEDLYVLARPLAYAMRDGQSQPAIESVLAKVRPAEWEQLSEVEQARLSLAIAHCALAELAAVSPE